MGIGGDVSEYVDRATALPRGSLFGLIGSVKVVLSFDEEDVAEAAQKLKDKSNKYKTQAEIIKAFSKTKNTPMTLVAAGK